MQHTEQAGSTNAAPTRPADRAYTVRLATGEVLYRTHTVGSPNAEAVAESIASMHRERGRNVYTEPDVLPDEVELATGASPDTADIWLHGPADEAPDGNRLVLHVRYIHAERGRIAFIMDGPSDPDPLGYSANVAVDTAGDLRTEADIRQAIAEHLNS